MNWANVYLFLALASLFGVFVASIGWGESANAKRSTRESKFWFYTVFALGVIFGSLAVGLKS